MTHRYNRHRSGLAVFLAVALVVVSVMQVSVAVAQEGEQPAAASPSTLLAIDAGDEPFLILRTSTRPSKIDVTIGGLAADVDAPVSLSAGSIDVQTVIVIDNSAQASEFLGAYVDAAVSYVQAAPPGEAISVWTTGGTARVRVGLNNEHDRTVEIIRNLATAAGASLLYDGIRGAALDMENTLAGATNVIVFAGSADGGSSSDAREARGSVQAIDGSAFVIASADTVSSSMSLLVSSTSGGAFATTEDLEEIAGYGTSVSQVVAGTWHVGFDSEVLADNSQIQIAVDGTIIVATYTVGSTSTGRALAPVEVAPSGGIPGLGFLEGDSGRLLGLVLGGLAAALGAYAVAMLFQKEESTLDAVLQAYSDHQSPSPEEDTGSAIGRSTLLKRAIEITEGLAERRGILARLEGMLERADMPLRAGEAITAYAGIMAASVVVGFLLAPALPFLIVFVVLGVVGPPFAVRFKGARRRKKFMGQLPDTLVLLSSTLKAGFSFMQGVEAVSKEIEDPMGGELRRIVTEAQLGRPLEDAMDASAERMGSPDFEWAVMAVKIQREVGGNLAELLLTVAGTMTERESLRRDISSLTAEGKMSAMVLGALPLLLGFVMWGMNPEYINTLFTDSLGKILLVGSIVAAGAGFAWMLKIINIDI